MTGSIAAHASGDTSGGRRGYHLEILLISFAALLLEISYTRIVSFKLYYYYTYLVIGLALLGIGTGGVLVAISGAAAASVDRPDPAVGAGARRVERRRRLPDRGTAADPVDGDLGLRHRLLDRERGQADRPVPGAVRVVHRGRCDDRDAVRSAPGTDRPALLRRPPRRGPGVRRGRPAHVVGWAAGDRVPRRA